MKGGGKIKQAEYETQISVQRRTSLTTRIFCFTLFVSLFFLFLSGIERDKQVFRKRNFKYTELNSDLTDRQVVPQSGVPGVSEN